MWQGRRHPHLILLVGFVFAACIYVFFLEPWGHDTWYHIQRLLDIEGQISRGVLYAHFADNAAQGKGLPVWIYYSQWIYWPPILLKCLGASTLISLKIVYGILLVVCSAGCYRLLRLHTDRTMASFGCLLFITSNYVIGEVFQRSAYAEMCSVAFLPFLLVAVHQTLRAPGRGSAAALVLFAGIMILAHPLSFMNAAWGLLAYVGYITIRWKTPPRRLLGVAVLFLLALALTAFYWLPAVVETRYVLGAEGVPTPLNQTFLTIPRYFKFYSILSLGFVLTAYAIAIAASMMLRPRPPEAPRIASTWPLIAGICVYVFLTLGVSEPLYKLPFLASNLWVWRVLFPLTLLVVLFAVVNSPRLPHWLRDKRATDSVAVLAVLQAVALVIFYTWSDVSIRRLESGEINATLAEEMGRLQGFGIDEYLPQPREAPGAGTECETIRPADAGASSDLGFVLGDDGSRACIHVRRYWNVRYAAFVDGRQVPVFADSNGEVLVATQGHSGRLSLRLTRPAYVVLSSYLSAAVALLFLAGLAWWPKSRQATPSEERVRE